MWSKPVSINLSTTSGYRFWGSARTGTSDRLIKGEEENKGRNCSHGCHWPHSCAPLKCRSVSSDNKTCPSRQSTTVERQHMKKKSGPLEAAKLVKGRYNYWSHIKCWLLVSLITSVEALHTLRWHFMHNKHLELEHCLNFLDVFFFFFLFKSKIAKLPAYIQCSSANSQPQPPGACASPASHSPGLVEHLNSC